MMEKQILITIGLEELEVLLEKMEALESAVEERFDAFSKRLEAVEVAIRDRNIEDQQPEYVGREQALLIFPYKETKLRELSKLQFRSGEQVIGTQSPNGSSKGKLYKTSDLREAGIRYRRYNEEQQSMDRKRR